MEVFLAGTAGVLAHLLIFISGEWHLGATKILKTCCISYLAIAIAEMRLRQLWWDEGLALSLLICGVFAVCLFISMITYRHLFHPLRHFPGPKLARTSKLWHVAQCLDSKNHLLMERLYETYGSFVRTGMCVAFEIDKNDAVSYSFDRTK